LNGFVNPLRRLWAEEHTTAANREILPLAMIETRKGVENLEAIAATPGLGGIYIGPADLAFAHARSPGFDREEPEMLAIIERIRQTCIARGIEPCIHRGTPDYARRMSAAGIAIVVKRALQASVGLGGCVSPNPNQANVIQWPNQIDL